MTVCVGRLGISLNLSQNSMNLIQTLLQHISLSVTLWGESSLSGRLPHSLAQHLLPLDLKQPLWALRQSWFQTSRSPPTASSTCAHALVSRCGWWGEPVRLWIRKFALFSPKLVACLWASVSCCLSFLVLQRIIIWLERERKGFETNDMPLVI